MNYFLPAAMLASVSFLSSCAEQSCSQNNNGLIHKTTCTRTGVHVEFSVCSSYWNETVRKGDVVSVTKRDGVGSHTCCGGILARGLRMLGFLQYSSMCCNATIIDIPRMHGPSLQLVRLNLVAQDIVDPSVGDYNFTVSCYYEHSILFTDRLAKKSNDMGIGNNTQVVNGTDSVIVEVTKVEGTQHEADEALTVANGDMLELKIELNKTSDVYSNILPYFCALTTGPDITDNPIPFVLYGCPDKNINKKWNIFKSWNATGDFSSYSMKFKMSEILDYQAAPNATIYIQCMIKLCINDALGTSECNATQACINNANGNQWNSPLAGPNNHGNSKSDYQLFVKAFQAGKNSHVVKSISVPIKNPTSKKCYELRDGLCINHDPAAVDGERVPIGCLTLKECSDSFMNMPGPIIATPVEENDPDEFKDTDDN